MIARKRCRRVHRQVVSEVEQVSVTGDDDGLRGRRQRDHVVILRIGRLKARRIRRVIAKVGAATEQLHELSTIGGWNA